MDISVATIDNIQKYWLIRTQGGEFYDQFFLDDYIAVGWDEFNDIELIKKSSKEIIVSEIRKKYPDESHPNHVYSQIIRFISELQIGDIVLIPSKNSTHISFGRITSEPYTVDVAEDDVMDGLCPYQKRRSVRWIKTIRRDDLDPYLYKLFYSHHTISDASDYSQYIDRTLHNLFIKNNRLHFVLQVTTKQTILARDLLVLIDSFANLADTYNEATESGAHEENVQIKLNVQSPGPVEMIMAIPAGIAVTSIIGHLILGGKYNIKIPGLKIGGETEGLLTKIQQLRQAPDKDKSSSDEGAELSEKIAQLQDVIKKLEVNLPTELISEENNTNGSTEDINS